MHVIFAMSEQQATKGLSGAVPNGTAAAAMEGRASPTPHNLKDS